MSGNPSMIQHNLRDDAGGDRHQNIVGARLNPMIATGRPAQMVVLPVTDHVLPVAVLGRKTTTSVERMIGARARPFRPPPAAHVAGWRMSVADVMRWSGMRRGSMWCMLVAAAVIVVPVVLGKGNTARCQKRRRDSNSDCFPVHTALRPIGKHHIRLRQRRRQENTRQSPRRPLELPV